MAIVRVQGNARGTIASGTSLAVAMAGAPTNGNVLVLTVSGNSEGVSRSVSSVVQTNVTWTGQIVKPYNSGGSYLMSEVWYGVVGASASANITVNFSGQIDYGAVANVCEYSGLLTVGFLDKTASAGGASVATSTGTTAATSQDSELWVGSTATDNQVQATPTNGFTLLDGARIDYVSNAYLEKIVAAAGTANSGTTVTSTVWCGCIATFKAPAAGGAVARKLQKLLLGVGL